MKVLCLFAAAVLSFSMVRTSRAADAVVPLPPTVADGAQLKVVFWVGHYQEDRLFEGPVWDTKSNKLFFTAHANGTNPFQILRLDEVAQEEITIAAGPGGSASIGGSPGKAAVWMNKTQGINGMTLSLDGHLLGAQGRAKLPSIVSIGIGENGPTDIKVLCAASKALPMVETNDLSQDLKGGIYFSAPDFAQKTRSAVFYCAPNGKLSRLITNLKLPNGLEVSNDGKTLYVSDSFEKRVYSYPIKDDGALDLPAVRIFFDPPTTNQSDPDGMTTDADGNLYFAMRGGIWVVSPDGKTLGLIPILSFVSNVTFGGTDGRTLFMTCSDRVYSLAMKAHGTRWK